MVKKLKKYFFITFFNQEMVSVIDQDGDGDISFNEFVWLMTRDKSFARMKNDRDISNNPSNKH